MKNVMLIMVFCFIIQGCYNDIPNIEVKLENIINNNEDTLIIMASQFNVFNDYIYLTDEADISLKKISNKENKLLKSVGVQGSGPGEYMQFPNIIKKSSGKIYCENYLTGQIKIYNYELDLLEEIHTNLSIIDFDVLNDTNIIVGDLNTNSLWHVNSSGSKKKLFKINETNKDDNPIWKSYYLINIDGNRFAIIYYYENKILIYNQKGKILNNIKLSKITNEVDKTSKYGLPKYSMFRSVSLHNNKLYLLMNQKITAKQYDEIYVLCLDSFKESKIKINNALKYITINNNNIYGLGENRNKIYKYKIY